MMFLKRMTGGTLYGVESLPRFAIGKQLLPKLVGKIANTSLPSINVVVTSIAQASKQGSPTL